MQPIAPRRRKRATTFVSPASMGEMFIPSDTSLPAVNYALARNATFSTNLDTKGRVYLERDGGDVTHVNAIEMCFLILSVCLFTVNFKYFSICAPAY